MRFSGELKAFYKKIIFKYNQKALIIDNTFMKTAYIKIKAISPVDKETIIHINRHKLKWKKRK